MDLLRPVFLGAGGCRVSAAPLELFDSAIDSHAGPDGCSCDAWMVRYSDGRSRPLPLSRWCNDPDRADAELLRRCSDPTLDVGCGPGRLVAALTAAGRPALGIDVAAAAVRLTRGAGARAVRRSVFDPLPNEGEWGTVLLADGNIGIGGEPVLLLKRCLDLLAPTGQILVELDPPGSASVSVQVRIEAQTARSTWFTWAHVAADGIEAPASTAGLQVAGSWTIDQRWFACLAR